MAAPQGLSPNCGPRRDGLRPELIVLHYTAMASAEAAVDRLCDPAAEVSAHYLITRTGDVVPLVPEALRAWHAGAGEWRGKTDINSRSIGIELDNDGASPFSAPLMAALVALLRGVMARWRIGPAGVIGHSDMAPGRKSDPGPRFDWARLERQGLAARRRSGTGPQEIKPEVFRALAQDFGITAEADDATLLEAVRLRFRPWARGPLSAEDFVPIGNPVLWTAR